MPSTTKTTPTKRTSLVKPISPFKKKKLFVDTNKVQEKKSNMYAIRIRKSPIILYITENGTPFNPASRYDGEGTRKKAWATQLEKGKEYSEKETWYQQNI